MKTQEEKRAYWRRTRRRNTNNKKGSTRMIIETTKMPYCFGKAKELIKGTSNKGSQACKQCCFQRRCETINQ